MIHHIVGICLPVFQNLSRLAQSVERQTLTRVSPISESYLNVVGSSPTLGVLFNFLGDALFHAWLSYISFLRCFMHHVMVLRIYYEPRVPETHAQPILSAPLAFGILKT